MVLQSLPASSNVANFTFLWNPLSELRGVKFFCNVKSMGQFGTLLPPRGATFTPFWGMVLQSLPASSNVANFTFLWNPLSELRGVKVFRNVKSMRFFGRYLPLGRTSYPRSLIKVIAHHSRLGRTFWHLIHGSVAKTAGGVARRISGRRRTILECTFPEENVKWCLQWQNSALDRY